MKKNKVGGLTNFNISLLILRHYIAVVIKTDIPIKQRKKESKNRFTWSIEIQQNTKSIQWKKTSFNKEYWNNGYSVQNKIYSYLSPHIKINSKCIIEVNEERLGGKTPE